MYLLNRIYLLNTYIYNNTPVTRVFNNITKCWEPDHKYILIRYLISDFAILVQGRKTLTKYVQYLDSKLTIEIKFWYFCKTDQITSFDWYVNNMMAL